MGIGVDEVGRPDRLFARLYGPHFTYEEFRCKCEDCFAKVITPGRGNTDDGEWFQAPEFKTFMAVLMEIRLNLGFPFIINSGHRCPDHNDRISGTGRDGPHTKGAADIKASFERAYKLNDAAADRDMGIGLKQTGDVAGRFIHVDNQGPRIWTY